MHILIFQHTAGEHPAVFLDHMMACGDTWQIVHLYQGDVIPTLDGFDMLLVMGGPMDVWETDDNPWLVVEKAAVREWVRDLDRPYLGVCLGHQLLADALDGACAKDPTAEIGVVEIKANTGAMDDPVCAKLGDLVTCFQWHGVSVSKVPTDGVSLFHNDQSHSQIMRVGSRAYGVQFHPELQQTTITDWLGDQGNRDAITEWMGADGPEHLIAEVDAHLPAFHILSECLYRGVRALA
jgi:GMP synthase-like glutamine amidotransferase